MAQHVISRSRSPWRDAVVVAAAVACGCGLDGLHLPAVSPAPPRIGGAAVALVALSGGMVQLTRTVGTDAVSMAAAATAAVDVTGGLDIPATVWTPPLSGVLRSSSGGGAMRPVVNASACSAAADLPVGMCRRTVVRSADAATSVWSEIYRVATDGTPVLVDAAATVTYASAATGTVDIDGLDVPDRSAGADLLRQRVRVRVASYPDAATAPREIRGTVVTFVGEPDRSVVGGDDVYESLELRHEWPDGSELWLMLAPAAAPATLAALRAAGSVAWRSVTAPTGDPMAVTATVGFAAWRDAGAEKQGRRTLWYADATSDEVTWRSAGTATRAWTVYRDGSHSYWRGDRAGERTVREVTGATASPIAHARLELSRATTAQGLLLTDIVSERTQQSGEREHVTATITSPADGRSWFAAFTRVTGTADAAAAAATATGVAAIHGVGDASWELTAQVTLGQSPARVYALVTTATASVTATIDLPTIHGYLSGPVDITVAATISDGWALAATVTTSLNQFARVVAAPGEPMQFEGSLRPQP